MAERVVQVYVAGHWCQLVAFLDVETHYDQLAAASWQPVTHPTLGLVYVVPRSHPVRDKPMPGPSVWTDELRVIPHMPGCPALRPFAAPSACTCGAIPRG